MTQSGPCSVPLRYLRKVHSGVHQAHLLQVVSVLDLTRMQLSGIIVLTNPFIVAECLTVPKQLLTAGTGTHPGRGFIPSPGKGS